jgi:DNA polymerase/3'-5' exonuclease PolX
MTLAEAQKIAVATCALLESFCERIAIAGSVRRKRPECNDVDIVAIPKLKQHRNLFGAVEYQEDLLRAALIDYARQNRPKVYWSTGKEPEPGAVNLILQGPKSQLDVFMATPATWATRLITRTGSLQHNTWIAKRALARRGQFKSQEGLYIAGGLFQPETEEQFYEALGLPFIPPEKREPMHLARLEVELATS